MQNYFNENGRTENKNEHRPISKSRMFRSALGWLLAVALLISAMPLNLLSGGPFARKAYADGSGNASDPYVIGPVSNEPSQFPGQGASGHVALDKHAEWVTGEPGVAKVTMSATGVGIGAGEDIVIIVDESANSSFSECSDPSHIRTYTFTKTNFEYVIGTAHFPLTSNVRVRSTVTIRVDWHWPSDQVNDIRFYGLAETYDNNGYIDEITDYRFGNKDIPRITMNGQYGASAGAREGVATAFAGTSSNEDKNFKFPSVVQCRVWQDYDYKNNFEIYECIRAYEYMDQMLNALADNILTPTSNNRIAVIRTGDHNNNGQALSNGRGGIFFDYSMLSTLKNITLGHNSATGEEFTTSFTMARDILNGRSDKSRLPYIFFVSPGDRHYSKGNPPLGNNGYYPPGSDKLVQPIDKARAVDTSGIVVYGLAINSSPVDDMRFMRGQDTYNISEGKKWPGHPNNPGYKGTFFDILGINEFIAAYEAAEAKSRAAFKDAVVTDIIGPEFELLVDASHPISMSQGTANRNQNTLTWNVGDMLNRPATLTYYIKLKSGVPNGTYNTSTEASMLYVNINYKYCKLYFPVTTLSNKTTASYKISYMLEDGITLVPDAPELATNPLIVTDAALGNQPIPSMYRHATLKGGFYVLIPSSPTNVIVTDDDEAEVTLLYRPAEGYSYKLVPCDSNGAPLTSDGYGATVSPTVVNNVPLGVNNVSFPAIEGYRPIAGQDEMVYVYAENNINNPAVLKIKYEYDPNWTGGSYKIYYKNTIGSMLDDYPDSNPLLVTGVSLGAQTIDSSKYRDSFRVEATSSTTGNYIVYTLAAGQEMTVNVTPGAQPSATKDIFYEPSDHYRYLVRIHYILTNGRGDLPGYTPNPKEIVGLETGYVLELSQYYSQTFKGYKVVTNPADVTIGYSNVDVDIIYEEDPSQKDFSFEVLYKLYEDGSDLPGYEPNPRTISGVAVGNYTLNGGSDYPSTYGKYIVMPGQDLQLYVKNDNSAQITVYYVLNDGANIFKYTINYKDIDTGALINSNGLTNPLVVENVGLGRQKLPAHPSIDGYRLAPNQPEYIENVTPDDLAVINIYYSKITISAKPGVDPIEEGDKIVTGTGVPGATIEITWPGGTKGTATVDENGNWYIDVPNGVELKDGDKVYVTQKVGSNDPSDPVIAVVGPKGDGGIGDNLSDTPNINPINENSTKVTGEGVPGATVTVTWPHGNVPSTATVNEQGKWEVSVPANAALKEGDVVTAVQLEAGKKPSTPAHETVNGGDKTGGGNDRRSDTPDIDPIHTGDKVISGIGTAGSEITVLLPGGAKVTTTVNSDDTWSINVPSNITLKKGQLVYAQQSTHGKQPSLWAQQTVRDTHSTKPGVDPIEEGDKIVTGTGEPGATIVITWPNGETDTATVDENGNWYIDVPEDVELKEGDKVYVTQTVDPYDPSEPVVVVVGPKGDGGIGDNLSDTPNINPINEDSTKVTGEGVPGAAIVVTWPHSGTPSTATVNEQGKWSVDVPENAALKEGDVVTAVQLEAGKKPSSPAHETVNGGDKTGGGNDRRSDTPDIDVIRTGDKVISGIGTAGSEITVLLPGGAKVTTTVNSDDTWSINVPGNIMLKKGQLVYAQQFTHGKQPSLWAQQTVRDTHSTKPGVDPIGEGDKAVTGTGEPGATIEITWPGGTTSTTDVDENGNWYIEVPENVELNEGDKVYVTQTEDPYDPSEPVEVVVGPKGDDGLGDNLSDTPNINPIFDDSEKVTGEGVPGATVVVTWPHSDKTSEATVDIYGNWEVDVPENAALEEGDIVTAVQHETGKKPSAPAHETVNGGDKTGGGNDRISDTPDINTIRPGDKVITGVGTHGSKITVKLPNGTDVETTVGPDDTWSVNVPGSVKLAEGDLVHAQQWTQGKKPSIWAQKTVTDMSSVRPTVDPIEAGDKVVTGTGVPGATIEITWPDGKTTSTATVDDYGNWYVNVPNGVELKEGDKVYVTQTVNPFDASEPVEVVVGPKGDGGIGDNLSDTPNINPINEDSTKVTGEGVPGATITVTWPHSNIPSEATVDINGKWEVNVPQGAELAEGDIVTAVQHEAGKKPSAPAHETVNGGDKTGGGNDRISDTPDIDTIRPGDKVVTGVGTHGSKVTVKFPNGAEVEATVGPDDTWSVNVPGGLTLAEGDLVYAQQWTQGKKPSLWAQKTVTDMSSSQPIVDPIGDGDTKVKGKGKPGSHITITWPNGSTSETDVDENGDWSIDIPVELEEGDEIEVTQTEPGKDPSKPTVVVVGPTYYNITYVLGGGVNNAANPTTYKKKDTPITLQDPSRAGYIFKYWAEGNTIALGSKGHKTFTAVWSDPIEYDITYVLGGGNNHIDNPAKYTVESPTITLKNPSRDGYNFVKWTEGYTIEKGSTGNKTFTAEWSAPIKYTITYVMGGGDNAPGNPTEYTVESETITLAAPTKAGYEFAGWTPDSGVITKGSTGNRTFTATWSDAIIYKITYDLKEGNNAAGNPSSYTVESPTITLAAPTKAGYHFTGWTPSDSIPAGSTGDKAFTATWSAAIIYKIDYEMNYGTNNPGNPTTYTVEMTPIDLKDPSRAGYTFVRWQEGGSIAKGETGDKKFTAVWSNAEVYDITYVLGGGQNHPSNPERYTVDDLPITLQNPTREGYTFLGWSPDNGYIPAGSTGNRTFTANWSSANEYSIYYELGAGGVNHPDNPDKYTVLNTPIELKAPSRDGYFFLGWAPDEGKIPAGGTGNRVFTALWSNARTYFINYNLDGGDNAPGNPTSYSVESPTITLAAPTKAGYEFKGWTPDNGVIPHGSTGDKTFTATWSNALVYNITYDVGKGTNDPGNPTTYTVLDTPITLKDPSRAGYRFDGWDKGNTIPEGSTGNKHFVAIWSDALIYNITYVLGGGTNHASNPAQYTIENTPIMLQNPSREGYDFVKWTEGNTIELGETGHRTFTAEWEKSFNPSEKPTINTVREGDVKVTGIGVPGSTITVTWPDGIATGTATVGPDGKWSVYVPAGTTLLENDDIYAAQTEAGKDESERVHAKVGPNNDGIEVGISDTPNIYPIKATETELKGKGVPGAKITVVWPHGGGTSEATVDAFGNWSVAVPGNANLAVGDVISATQLEANKKISAPAHVTVDGGDKTNPGHDERSDTPFILLIRPGDRFVGGYGVPGSKITVQLPNGVRVETVVDAQGVWTIDTNGIYVLKDGDRVYARQTTPGKSPSIWAQRTVTDMTSAKPDVDPIHEGDKKVTGKGKPGSHITIKWPNGNESETTVDEDGNWSIDVPGDVELSEGDKVLVTQTEPGMDDSDPVEETVGAKIPNPSLKPYIAPVREGDTRVTGAGVAGAKIVVTWPNSNIESVTHVAADGTWSVVVPSSIALKLGDRVYATQTEIGKDVSDPTFVVVGPNLDGTGEGLSDTPNIDPINDADKKLTGKGVPGATITVEWPNGAMTVGIKVDAYGDWSADVPASVKLAVGDIISATQQEPNKLISAPARVTVGGGDKTNPSHDKRSDTPYIILIRPGDRFVGGYGVPGSEITVLFKNGVRVVTTVDTNGIWAVEKPANYTLEAGDLVYARQWTPGKTPSIWAQKTVTDMTSSKPTVDPINEGDNKVKGKGKPGSHITINWPNGSTSETTVDEDGNWSIDVPEDLELKEGDKVEVTQTEPGKDKGDPETVTVGGREKSAMPTVNQPHPGDKSISGTGIPGATITVTWPRGKVTQTTVGPDGKWTAIVPDGENIYNDAIIKVTQKEKDKAESNPVIVIVYGYGNQPSPAPGGSGGGPGGPAASPTPTPSQSPSASPRPSSTPTPSSTPKSSSNSSNKQVYGYYSGEPRLPRYDFGFEDGFTPLSGFKSDHIKYINGYLDNSVQPDSAITRAEVAAIIFRLLEDEAKNNPVADRFPDVAMTEWYAQNVTYLASIGVLKGYLDGAFRPDARITRAEFATMMSRFDNLEATNDNMFTDTAGHWAVGYINSAAKKGWISGYYDGSFKPEDNITRAEVVTVINRVLYRGIQEEDVPFWAPRFIDLPTEHWAYTAITEASIGHNYERKPNGFENWTRNLG